MTCIAGKLDREQLAARVAVDIPEGVYVNLGIGLPTTVANYLPKDKDIFLQSENGLLGMGEIWTSHWPVVWNS
jgi:3-oxoadipate CoA-transferase beta subunit